MDNIRFNILTLGVIIRPHSQAVDGPVQRGPHGRPHPRLVGVGQQLYESLVGDTLTEFGERVDDGVRRQEWQPQDLPDQGCPPCGVWPAKSGRRILECRRQGRLS